MIKPVVRIESGDHIITITRKVCKTLRDLGLTKEASAFAGLAIRSKSREGLLKASEEYVQIEVVH